MAIIHVAADATTAAKTEARAPACRALRPSTDTSSMLPSRQGTGHQPTSRSTLGRQIPDYGSDNDDLIIRNLPVFLANSA